ncbi:A24 family peptidase [Bacillus sp. OAE603]|uniref:prepilin peptidase n=1 Tax=Gottfriedia sp. OAE603 TaxID=2663872 RepID=UPI00178A9036
MNLIYFCFFILGLVFGSFFNVVGLRVPLKKSIFWPRSACSNCGHTLHSIELIPIFSYVLQKGKCRNCGAHISILYPLIELLTGCLFVFALYQIGFEMELLIALTFISLLVIIIVSDLAYMLIPDRILLLFLSIFIIERFFIPLESWWNSMIGAVGAFTVLFLIALVSNGGMGGGDIKLFGVLGFALGWKLILITFMIACFTGTIFGLILMKAGRVQKRNPIPFGPFIGLGGLVSYFYGNELLRVYLSILS